MSAKRHLIETMAATCHSVVSPTLHQAPRNDCGKHTNPTSEQIRKLVLRIPKESTQPLHLYQLRHEVAYLQYLAQKVPEIPALRVLLWHDQAGQPFIAEEFIEGQAPERCVATAP
ncbi:hypothetical protein BDBG_05251 [Blastomyces gilchristii SLH14081]|uniref:Uncharacterized protein n=1 Tax=Blastomyces gilchristii (strain SLH14081) TaxID=559298 RepID=A0A179UNS0_BLAGS|nr:uncharacterized protein BDBG_05251 [Blastomyces gilchristii SLH14081]OAT09480.1 hypothetical protein BDBG_05251 [Blastomyces gilchristii SLH14081]